MNELSFAYLIIRADISGGQALMMAFFAGVHCGGPRERVDMGCALIATVAEMDMLAADLLKNDVPFTVRRSPKGDPATISFSIPAHKKLQYQSFLEHLQPWSVNLQKRLADSSVPSNSNTAKAALSEDSRHGGSRPTRS